ncbi:unnamed protein product [Alopecurus aequalis]
MAKGRNKKNRAKNGDGAASMDTTEGSAPAASTAAEAPERNFELLCFLFSDLLVFHSLTRIFSFLPFPPFAAMDTSEGKQQSSASTALSSISRKIKKGAQTKRTKNMRKMKAVARAISKTEKSEEKVLKAKSKKTRIQSAKSLYD